MVKENQEQSNTIKEKSIAISRLTELKSENEATIQTLTYEIADIKRNLKLLENERDSLLSKSSSESKEKTREVQMLEEVSS